MARKKKKISVDFSGIETRKRVPSGDYVIGPREITEEKGEKAKYLAWQFEVKKGPCKGGTLFYNTSEAPNALWNLKNVLESMEIEVPDGVMDLDLKQIINDEPTCGCTVELGTFEGKPQSRIVDIFPADQVEEIEEDDDDSDDDDDKVTSDDITEMSAEELEEIIDDKDLDVDLDDYKSLKKKRKAVAEALEEPDEGEDDDDDDDSDDDEKYSGDEINLMKKKEIKEIIKKHELDVELTGKIRKDRKLVIEALEEEDLMEEED